MSDQRVLLELVSGSRLYGTSHANSDLDMYRVVDSLPRKKRARQTMESGVDVVEVTFAEFVRQAHEGAPQALEAMFAPNGWPSVDKLEAYRNQFVAGTNSFAVFQRTIERFRTPEATFKQQRHSFRLEYALTQLQKRGRFNPADTGWLSILPPELAFPGT